MPIIGMNFNSINANVTGKNKGSEISVNSSPKVDDIEKTNIEVAGLKDVLKILFTFETKYEPEVGEIVIKGEVLYHTEGSNEIVAKWKKDKKVDDKLVLDVFNALFRKCLTKVIELSEELRLPPPVQFPMLKPAEGKKE